MSPDTASASDGVSLCQRVELAKNELERMLDRLPQGILLIDRQGVVQRVNRALLGMAGATEFKNVLGHPGRQLFDQPAACLSPERIATAFDNLDGPDSRSRVEEFTIERKTGRQVFEATFFPRAPDADHIIVMIEDATERREASARRERLQRLEMARASLGGLLHTMNQPLTVIMSEAYVLADACRQEMIDQPAVFALAETIVRRVDELKQIMERIQNLDSVVMEHYVGQTDILRIV